MADLFGSLVTSASALTAERLRMNVIAGNIANANTTRTAGGGPYQRQVAVLAQTPQPFDATLAALSGDPGAAVASSEPGGVQVAAIVPDTSPFRLVYDPGHPDADAQGFVRYPNVDVLQEMVELMAASRTYEANLTAFNTAKAIAQRTLEIGR